MTPRTLSIPLLLALSACSDTYTPEPDPGFGELGVGVFLFAMRWDSSDPARQTRRSDVAFWLHLLAATGVLLIVFAIFSGRRRNKRRFERLLREAREEGRRSSTETVPTA